MAAEATGSSAAAQTPEEILQGAWARVEGSNRPSMGRIRVRSGTLRRVLNGPLGARASRRTSRSAGGRHTGRRGRDGSTHADDLAGPDPALTLSAR